MTDECNLINLAEAFPQLIIDMKYATADNICGQPVYCEDRCLLHPDAATALEKSIAIAALAGFSLLIYDAYRPQQAQHSLWQACPDPRWVAEVSLGSNHSRGVAVDLTLTDAEGRVLDMGAGFDDMHERSHPYYPGLSQEAHRNRLLLNAIMFGGGFRGIATEWWHFELPDAQTYPLLRDRFACFSTF
ncbi:D-alanyl-D-alanine dipeptidase [Erwinia mallotivora]|uniref:D-alanyl-D-alanine dipeptidase n=1 Tax=Erwinia mallotivora TaxID=69222 RepID=A0A014NME9_9GAMM|nr:D-alanyl-D-alanine dipeptidase [Erwinia mallotivora]EXU74995.1 D-alanyl-D-alanine dipeptidase [Erwinia mallotivora]